MIFCQVLVDAKMTTFDNTLRVDGSSLADDEDILDFISGSYSCIVINSQNMSTNTYNVTGKDLHFLIIVNLVSFLSSLWSTC